MTVVNAVVVCQVVGMKSITVLELHEQTDAVVQRVAEEDGFVITSEGEPLAILRSVREPQVRRNPLPRREASTLPTTRADSTLFISEERDGR